MKIKFIYVAVLVCIIGLASCERYTDISPKGKSLLNNAEDLDYLMNVNYASIDFNDLMVLDNDMYPYLENIPNLISSNVKGLNYVLTTYDESIDRAELTIGDPVYDRLYGYIANVANIILKNADGASGDQTKLRQLKAEAYILRAYMHYMLVNKYAKAYNPSTAETDGGIPYVEDIDFEQVNPKNTMKQVYEKLVRDIDAAFELNALLDKGQNSMRIGKGFAYCLKARVLLSMRDYEGALVAATEGIKYNNALEDHRPFLAAVNGGTGLPASRKGLIAPDNLLYAFNFKMSPHAFSVSNEILQDYYETGNIIKDHTETYNYTFGSLIHGLAGLPLFYNFAYEQNSVGFTTSDLFMVKAEALIRTGAINEGMNFINQVRLRRVYPYSALAAADASEAMAYLQKTARIEFLFTWRNFSDVKRWNREGNYPVITKRVINGTAYTLSSSSPLWVFPFPQSATQFNPTLTQNY